MSYKHIVEKLEAGEQVELNPKGNSMTPKIESGQKIVISPITEEIEVGDIVLAKVKGRYYIHLVTAIDKDKNRWQISNNHGHINGWSSKIFGVVSEIG